MKIRQASLANSFVAPKTSPVTPLKCLFAIWAVMKPAKTPISGPSNARKLKLGRHINADKTKETAKNHLLFVALTKGAPELLSTASPNVAAATIANFAETSEDKIEKKRI